MKRTKRNILPAVLIAAAAVMALAALLIRLSDAGPDASTREGRQAFLAGLGWEIEPDSEELKTVLIPDCSEGVMADYNALQRSQGYDLSGWEGKTCTQVSYRVTNYPGYDQTVYVTLYITGKRVIAGDVHSAALNGFMHGLTRSAGV